MFLTSKRFWKIFATITAVGLSVLLLLYGGVAWWTSYSLESRLARLRAAGEPTSIRELEIPAPVDDNAALVLKKVRPQLEAFSKAQATFDELPAGTPYRPDKPTEEQIEMIRGILAMYPEVPVATLQAANCNYYASLYDYSLAPTKFLEGLLSSNILIRNVARFGSWQVAIAIADQEYDQGVQIGINTLRLARLYDQEPTINSGLVALAIRGMAVRDLNRVLRLGEVSPEMRLLLDQELALHDDPLWFVKLLKTERAYSLDASRELFGYFPMTWQGRLLQADILDMYGQLLPELSKPWHESRGAINPEIARSSSTPISATMLQLVVPAMQAAHDAYHRAIAQMRSLRILNALQAHKEENGREAQSLDDLDLPATALVDPFDGKQLKFKMTDEGWLIYSAYQNRKDDGGKLESMDDMGVAPLGYPGGD